MTRLVPLLFVSALLAGAETFSGVITDSMCKLDHKSMNAGPDEECAKKCVESGSKWKYVLFDGKNTYKLSDQETPVKFLAKRVTVTGKLYQKTGIIEVDRIEAVK